MEMGKEIRRLRDDRGITQEALAKALNVTPQTISKWERGTSMPDVGMLPKIAVYFGVTIDQLFAMDPEQQLERIENRIYSHGLFDEAEERQLEKQLNDLSSQPDLEGRAQIMLTKLYNHQAEQYRSLAVQHGIQAAEKTDGDSDAISELANAWGSFIPDWCARNHHQLIGWFSSYCSSHPENRSAHMWLLDNLIDDRRLLEAREWLEKLSDTDHTFRVPMYRYMIAQAAGETEEADTILHEMESMQDQEWCWAVTLGDIYTMRQEYDKAIEWYRKGQEIQPSPKFTDSAVSIAHICEIRGDQAGAVSAYREQLRLMREEWGIVSGEECEEVERTIHRLLSL